jgi:hypothetical protein
VAADAPFKPAERVFSICRITVFWLLSWEAVALTAEVLCRDSGSANMFPVVQTIAQAAKRVQPRQMFNRIDLFECCREL